MTLPLSIARQLLLLSTGGQLPASSMRHAVANALREEGIIAARIAGRTKATLFIADLPAFELYLANQFGISSLTAYIATLEDTSSTRGDLVAVSSNSKTQARRTFTGFLVNSFAPVPCMLRGNPMSVHPLAGTFLFVSDYTDFVPGPDVIVAGVEIAEVFGLASQLAPLFVRQQVLFVSRYPQHQSKDLIRWLQHIPNRYLHLGDFDAAGINIYLHEFKKYLGDRATFFVPTNIEALLAAHGNRALYDRQDLTKMPIAEADLIRLTGLLHEYKAGLEQEILLVRQ
jgi:hypothetical protein